ncbi:YmdB family metallophosphoesterase [Patescibacteria group bacterium]|nr:YmdB family metallophosphoesterase [Patescibacteria group bacterium]MBU1702856.1 YmdB family metallophosphoesterase [Patescibacteria group bacterium]MBU1954188.1 YmdB family metallophosphoesterase [Patescibacteria group bacterium]
MNILFIGDIFGRPGRNAVTALLPKLKAEFSIDFVVANAENMRHGKGVTIANIAEMQAAGVDFFTSGNHVFKDSSVVEKMDDPAFPLLRPSNYPKGAPGHGYRLVSAPKGKKVLVMNLMGRVFMTADLDCPFREADAILRAHEGHDYDAIFVDFHAEATSEIAALGHYLDGRVSAFIGTHSHVPTADARILNGGTAFQTDVGMVGPLDSVIGAEKQLVIDHFITQMPLKIEVACGPCVFNGVKIEIDPQTKMAKSILPIQRIVD